MQVGRACLTEQGFLHQKVKAVACDVEASSEVNRVEEPSMEEASPCSSGDAEVFPDAGGGDDG